MSRLAMVAGAIILLASAEAAPEATSENYAPYEFLIGDWISNSGGTRLRQSFSWGPARSYIRYSTYMQRPGSAEQLHFDGIMLWNGKSRALDFLFAVEPGSGIQEKGTVTAIPGQPIVREVELTAKNGSVSYFRQTFQRTGPQTVVTSLMSRTETGWQPNFPGADRIEMRRATIED